MRFRNVSVEQKFSFIDKKTFHTGTTIAGAIFKVSYAFAMFPMIMHSLSAFMLCDLWLLCTRPIGTIY